MSKNTDWPLTLLISILIVSCTGQQDADRSFGGNDETTIENPEYGTWQNSENSPVLFELEKVFGAESEDTGVLFSSRFSIIGPVAHTSNNIYILDRGTSKLMSFSNDGKLIWETGQEGKGPGDFMNPRGLATDGQFLFLDNNGGSRIDKFDMQGNFIESLIWDSSELPTVTIIGFLPNGNLVSTSTLWGEIGIKINVLDLSEEMSVLSQFDIRVDVDIDLDQGGSSSIGIGLTDSLIIAGNNARYRLQFFDQYGNPVKVINRDFERIVRPGVYQSGTISRIRTFGGLMASVHLKDGYMLTSLVWPLNVNNPDKFTARDNPPQVIFANSIDLFDQNGHLLYSIEETDSNIPEIGEPVFVDQNGKLYTKTDSPYPQVRRYSVNIHN